MTLIYRACRLLSMLGSVPLWPMTMRGRRRVPTSGGAVLISNHQSFLDLIFIGQAVNREITYVARTTLWNSLFYRAITWPFRFVRIRRGESDLAALKDGIERLKRGEIILLFPEGTRTRTGQVGPFTMGFHTLASRAGVPIVPIRVSGSYKAWPRSQLLPYPRRVVIDIFPPLDIRGMSKEEVRSHLFEKIYRIPPC
jgi:1-acyl-sn-glycerol-3-phosphate acyltransferase